MKVFDISFLLIWIILFMILTIMLIFLSYEPKQVNLKNGDHQKYLQMYGITKISNIFNNTQLTYIINMARKKQLVELLDYIKKHTGLFDKIKHVISNDYVFNEYVFLINKSCIHTCHRDYNSHYYNNQQMYPSYTIIIYLNNMDKCLDIIPGSHKTKTTNDYNIVNNVQSVICKRGDILLFDANLIHSGSINDRKDNPRIQLKICHKNDYKVLNFYNNYYKILNEDVNNNTYWTNLQQKFSCQLPGVAKILKKYDRNVNKYENDGGIISKLYPQLENIST